ncbi:hypothetical protein NA78x_001717 [Anatilimnocola sp. NA78]|uniref:hypothetical protein n=1 Tax=Anatilimnocola sp. NA78 TaxID=3415683 RepID=UPI003CE51D3A
MIATGKVMLICGGCSMRVRELDPADIPGERGIVCGRCGNRMLPHTQRPDPGRRKPAPDHGPGTELKKLLASVGLTDFSGCGCASKIAQMNRWGVEGCRQHIDQICGWIEEAKRKAGWREQLKAATLATANGLAFKLDPRDPIRSLVELAIESAVHLPIDPPAGAR